MVIVKSKSKNITKQKQKQRQTVIVNIDTKKTRSKRQPRNAPKKPREDNNSIANPLHYPSVIHSVQQPFQNPMPTLATQAITDAVREAVRNITHDARKDQYLEQLQHSNDLERKPEVKVKAEVKAEAKAEAKAEQESLQEEKLPLQTLIEIPAVAPIGQQQEAPISNVPIIPILAEQAPRVPTPLEKPIENENKVMVYTGKQRESEDNSSRPYLKPVNLKPLNIPSPFSGTGNVFNSPFVKLEHKSLRDKMLAAAEERLRKENQQLAVISQPSPPPEPEAEPAPVPKQRKKKRTVPQQLAEYDKETVMRIAKDNGLQLSTKERTQNKQLLVENLSNRLNPKTVDWKAYPKLKSKK